MMKTRYLSAALICALTISLVNCGQGDALLCNLKAEEYLVTSSDQPFEITYLAKGDGVLSRIVYRDGNGILHTETNIELPWEKMLVIPANETAMVSVSCKMGVGKKEVSISGTNGETTIKSVDSCRL